MQTLIARRWLWPALLGVLALAFAASALAEPGGKDDPLITLGYARKLAGFQLRKVGVNQPLLLSPGAELVIVSPEGKQVNAAGLAANAVLINLSSGQRVLDSALSADQHFVYAGDAPLSLRFDSAVTCLVRGESK